MKLNNTNNTKPAQIPYRMVLDFLVLAFLTKGLGTGRILTLAVYSLRFSRIIQTPISNTLKTMYCIMGTQIKKEDLKKGRFKKRIALRFLSTIQTVYLDFSE